METKQENIDKLVAVLKARATGNANIYAVTKTDATKLSKIANSLNIPFEWLVNLINFESAGTFSPKVKNPTSSASGLIQFMATTARAYGTTTATLRGMTFSQQLDYVEKYLKDMPGFKSGKAPANFTQLDLFMGIFYPSAMYKGTGYTFNATVQKANPGIKTAGDYFKYAKEKAIFPDVPNTLDQYNAWNTGTATPEAKSQTGNLFLFAVLAVGLFYLYKKSTGNA